MLVWEFDYVHYQPTYLLAILSLHKPSKTGIEVIEQAFSTKKLKKLSHL